MSKNSSTQPKRSILSCEKAWLTNLAMCELETGTDPNAEL